MKGEQYERKHETDDMAWVSPVEHMDNPEARMEQHKLMRRSEMNNDLFIVAKGATRIQLTDKVSALHLISALAALECTEPITSSKISGCKDYGDVYEVVFLDKAIKVAGQKDAETVLNWMLTFGCTKVSIEKLYSKEGDEE